MYPKFVEKKITKSYFNICKIESIVYIVPVTCEAMASVIHFLYSTHSMLVFLPCSIVEDS